MKTLDTRRINKQAAANCNLFDSFRIGQFFTVVSPGSSYIPFRLQERYFKVDADTVQSVTDGRRWKFAMTEASGASVVVVPEGARSCATYDVNWK